MSKRIIRVEYIGKIDQIITEYNGKKYVFSKKNPIKEIPEEVFDYFKSTSLMHITSLRIADPVAETATNKKAQKMVEEKEAVIPKEAVVEKPAKRKAKKKPAKRKL